MRRRRSRTLRRPDGGADFSAHQGAVKVPEGWVTGWIYNPTDDKWRELGVFDLDTLGQRKVAARQLHDALLAWEAGVEAVAYEKPPTDVHDGDDVPGLRALGELRRLQQRQRYLDGRATDRVGRCDGDGREGHHDRARRSSRRRTTVGAANIPEEACAWASPVNASRENLGEARLKSTQEGTETTWFDGEETDLTMIELGNGAWIEEIT